MADRHQELARLWTRHLPVVETYLVSMWVRPEDVEELLQETVTQVFQQVDKFDSTRPFLPWALGFAKYVVLRHRRDLARERHVFSHEVVENLSQAFEEVSGTQEALRRFLEDCFAKLSARAKWLCRLRYEHNMSRDEIARHQGVSLSAVKMGLYRAREQLRGCIERRLQSEGLR